MKTLLLAPAVLVLAAGCQTSAPTGTAEAPRLTTTTVHLGEDGSTEIDVLHETQQEREARLALAHPTPDTHGGAVAQSTVWEPCGDYSDMYLCDTGAQYCSGGNIACVYGYGSISLASIPRGNGGNWSGMVSQYEPDNWPGHFTSARYGACNPFAAGYTEHTASLCEVLSNSLSLCKAKGSICAAGANSTCCGGRCACGTNPLLCVCQ